MVFLRYSRFTAALGASLIASAAQAEGGGLPHIQTAWYPNQLLWLAISFIMLYALVSRWIMPSVASVLGQREQAISEAIAEAERARQEAETTRGDFESAGNSARAQAAEIMAAAQAKNSAATTETLAKLDHELARKIDQAHARIEDAVSKAQGGLETATIALTTAMAEKLLGHAVTGDTVSEAVKPMAKAS